MAYQINKTDGSLLTAVPDSQVDENSTNLTLIGKNYSGFGEAFNENLIKLLENFSDTRAPDKPIRGQLWFDVSESKIKVYNGNRFVPVSSATISNSRPESLGIGDLWFDSIRKQLFFFDGTDTILLAPLYSASQNLSGFQIRSILDSLNQTRVISLLYNNGILLGIFSKDAFTPKNPIEGFVGSIEPGFNSGSLPGLKFRVTATNAEQLGGADALTYVRRDTSNSINGQLRITSNLGVVIGDGGQGNFVINDGNLIITNAAAGRNINLSVRRGIDQESALVISAEDRIIDLYPEFENSLVRVGGNLTVNGNLTVQGTTTTINTANITIEDKAIELASLPSGDTTDITADEGGIILNGATPKVILWSNTGNSSYPFVGGGLYSQAWNSSENINLGTNKYYAIDGVPIVEQTSTTPGSKTFKLTAAVTAIDGVTSFGKQNSITVGPGTINDPAFLRLEDNIIFTEQLDQDLVLFPNGNGNVVLQGSPRITGLSNPAAGEIGKQDAATREYVDNQISTKEIVLSIDLSDGKPNSYIINNILNGPNIVSPGLVEDITTASARGRVSLYRNGTKIRMLCSILSNSSTSVDLNSLINQSTSIFSTPSSGTASAVTNVALSQALLPGATVAVTRLIKIFEMINGSWSFVSDYPLPA